MAHYWTGCSGFYYRNWKHFFYPDTVPVKDWFAYYAEHFNTVEINASFYRLPKLVLLRRWYKLSPASFRFSIKVPRTITHFKKFQDIAAELAEFYQLVTDGLGEKVGAILFQLPPSIHYSADLLQAICNQVNPDLPNVIEFRHASWWCEDVYTALRKANITFCSVSFPGLPTTIIKTTNTIYSRLHGVPQLYYSAYSIEELADWSQSVHQQKAEQVYTYFNNTAQLEAIGNARLIHAYLSGEKKPRVML